jgi:predicted HD phosphohydrolase
MIGLSEATKDRMDDCGVVNHEGIGRLFCDRLGFPDTVGQIVEGHVKAKRYLCWKHPEYQAKLSDASKTTLKHQGGPMEDAEATLFEKSDLFDTIIRMRSWDEAAKVPDKAVPTLADWEPTMRTLLDAGATTATAAPESSA